MNSSSSLALNSRLATGPDVNKDWAGPEAGCGTGGTSGADGGAGGSGGADNAAGSQYPAGSEGGSDGGKGAWGELMACDIQIQ
jgi:hypothetical protein